jgi:hypothetical protein
MEHSMDQGIDQMRRPDIWSEWFCVMWHFLQRAE